MNTPPDASRDTGTVEPTEDDYRLALRQAGIQADECRRQAAGFDRRLEEIEQTLMAGWQSDGARQVLTRMQTAREGIRTAFVGRAQDLDDAGTELRRKLQSQDAAAAPPQTEEARP